MTSSGDFTIPGKLTAAVKGAFIAFNEDFGKIKFGIQSPPTFAKVEGLWRYRSLEKTPLDLQKWSSSRDFGISFTGKQSIFSYTLMLGNSSSNKSETDKGEKLYVSFGISPMVDAILRFTEITTGYILPEKISLSRGLYPIKDLHLG